MPQPPSPAGQVLCDGGEPVTNKIYAAGPSGAATVIDGATNVTATIPNVVGSFAVALNPVTNKIYVANYDATSNGDRRDDQRDRRRGLWEVRLTWR